MMRLTVVGAVLVIVTILVTLIVIQALTERNSGDSEQRYGDQ